MWKNRIPNGHSCNQMKFEVLRLVYVLIEFWARGVPGKLPAPMAVAKTVGSLPQIDGKAQIPEYSPHGTH